MMRNQKIIDPKTLRKAIRRDPAEVALDDAPTIEMVTAFELTESISVDTKGYEVRDLLLAPGCSTAEFFHDKKVRTFVVVAGQGTLIQTQEGESGELKLDVTDLTVGSAVTCEPGIKYRLCATPESSIQVLVVQDSKYGAKLTETAEAVVSHFGAQLDLSRKVAAERPVSRRGRSKAAQQQTEIAAERGKLGVEVTPGGPLPSAFIPEGINAQPMVLSE